MEVHTFQPGLLTGGLDEDVLEELKRHGFPRESGFQAKRAKWERMVLGGSGCCSASVLDALSIYMHLQLSPYDASWKLNIIYSNMYVCRVKISVLAYIDRGAMDQ